MIIPAGAPPWLRSNDLTHYGGDVNKQNYLSRGVIDALTDVGAEQFSRMAADLAALQRTAAFCEITLRCNDTSPAAPTFEFVNMMTGVVSLAYAGDNAPSGFPSGARVGDGDVTVTFASAYADPYGVSAAFGLTHVTTEVIAASEAGPRAKPFYTIGDTLLELKATDNSGTPIQNARIVLVVY